MIAKEEKLYMHRIKKKQMNVIIQDHKDLMGVGMMTL